MRLGTEIRRQEILECARKILAGHGAEGLTVKELAGAVGVSEGAIYRHFQSKKEILLALIDEIEETLFECIERARSGAGSPLEELEDVLREHLSYSERRRGVSFLVISEVLRNGNRQLRQRMQAVIGRYLSVIEGILGQGVSTGQVDPNINLRAAAILLFGQVQGAVTLWHFATFEDSLAERHEVIWQLYRRAVAACPVS